MVEAAHPSFLELDQLFIGTGAGTGSGAGSAAARAHATTCERCRAHLERLEQPVASPQWTRPPARAGRPPWVWPAVALAGLCALGLMTLKPIARARDPFQVKGSGPGLALYLKRGARVTAWNGTEAVRAGDLLRLEVAPEGFRHITVDSPESPGRHLFDGELAEATAFLPVSWKVDDRAGPEVLDITLVAPDASPWHSRLILPKSTGP